MSQPIAQQATKNKRTIYVTTIRFSVAIGTTKESKRYLSRQSRQAKRGKCLSQQGKLCLDRIQKPEDI